MAAPRALLASLLIAPSAWGQEARDPLATIRGPHGADAPARTRRAETWDAYGDARLRAVGGSNTALDPQGTLADETWWLSTRLIAGADWRPSDKVLVQFELEAANGRVAGTFTDVGLAYSDDVFRVRRADTRDLIRVLPRRLGVTITEPTAGQFRVGVEMFTWGTGILANDGAGDPDFGDPKTGSIVARLGYVAAPWRFRDEASDAARGTLFFLSGDVVLRDETASILDGDLAVQGVVGFRVAHPVVDVGAFAVGRWQRDRTDPLDPRPDPTTVTAFPLEVYGKVLLSPPNAKDYRVVLETEAVLIHGHTDRAYLEETVATGADIQSFGAVARLRFDHDALGITAKVEAGIASGDNDSRDDVVRTFSFHSDHNVGMLLFEHVLPRITARSLDQALNPDLVAVPSPGGRYTVNQGAVSNAVYVNPVFRVRPVAGLDLRVGYLAAWSAGDFVDLYESNTRGGFNTTPGGVSPGGHFFGHEVDGAVRYTVSLPGQTAIDLGVEAAVLLPGDAFEGIAGDVLDTQWLARGRLAFQW